MAQVPTLALVNGIQAVTFTDGDPGVQVSFATPRTYFVVTQLTLEGWTVRLLFAGGLLFLVGSVGRLRQSADGS